MTAPRIVLGIDPGARDTGVVVAAVAPATRPDLLAHTTIPARKGTPLLPVPADYVADVVAACVDAFARHPIQLVAVEGVKAPNWHHRGKAKPIDPSATIATAVVYGAILGRAWPVELVTVDPGNNGARLPAPAYPEPIRIAPGGRGHDKRRHERSALDVAMRGDQLARFPALRR